jgi:hypothetical protein
MHGGRSGDVDRVDPREHIGRRWGLPKVGQGVWITRHGLPKVGQGVWITRHGLPKVGQGVPLAHGPRTTRCRPLDSCH